MKELNLLLQLPQDVSTRYRSVDMTVLAPEPPSLVQMPCVKATKSAAFCGCLPVSVLECFPAFVNRGAVSGFGLGLLVSRGFFDAKAFFAVVREGVADKPG